MVSIGGLVSGGCFINSEVGTAVGEGGNRPRGIGPYIGLSCRHGCSNSSFDELCSLAARQSWRKVTIVCFQLFSYFLAHEAHCSIAMINFCQLHQEILCLMWRLHAGDQKRHGSGAGRRVGSFPKTHCGTGKTWMVMAHGHCLF